MAIAYVDGNVGSTAAGANNVSTANIAVSGSDLLLLGHACSGDYTGLAPSAVKWGGSGGTGLSKVADQSIATNFNATLWQLKAPTVQTSTAYSLWPSNLGELGLIGVAYSGVDQTTPTGTVAVATGTGTTAPSVNVSSVAGDIVVGFCYVGSGGGGITSLTSGQTERKKIVTLGGAGYEAMSASETTASGTTTTMSWTASKSVSWVAIGVALKAAAAGTTITPGAGAVALAGSAPTVAATGNKAITPSAGAVVLAGAAPSVASGANKSVTPSAGAVTIAGATPVLTLTLPAPGAGAIVLTGYAPTVTNGQSYTITPTAGAVVVSGSAPTLAKTANQWVTPAAGAVVVSGSAPTLAKTANQWVTPTAGAVVLSGSAPAVLNGQSYLVTPAAGAVSLAGAAPSVSATAHQTVTPGAASVVLSGSSPVLAFSDNRVVTPDAGAVVLAGAAPSLSQAGGWNLTPGAGAIQITGYAPVVIGKRPQGAGKSSSKRRRVVIGERVYEVNERDIPALIEAELLDRAPPVTAEVVAGPKPPRKRRRKAAEPVKTVEQVREVVQQIKARIEPDNAWLVQALEAVAFRVLERLQDEEDSLMLLLAA